MEQSAPGVSRRTVNGPRRASRFMGVWIILSIAAAILLAPVCYVAGAVAQYEWIARPALLRSAGPVHLAALQPSVDSGTVIPAGLGTENAARYYMSALQSFNKRRVPMLATQKLNPFLTEPRLSRTELALLDMALHQNQCNFYEERGPTPRFSFTLLPANKSYPMRGSADPFEQRPYIAPIRDMAQAALNYGRSAEDARAPAIAEQVYRAIARLGAGLRSHPGSFLDLELGTELELRSLHYLQFLYTATHEVGMLQRANIYARAVTHLERAVRDKYAQLDNVEVDKLVLLHDAEPLWRVEAAFALDEAEHTSKPGRLEQLSDARTMQAALHDSSAHVRRTVAHILAMRRTDFRDPRMQ